VESGASLTSATLYARYNRLNLLPFWQLTYDPQVWDSHNRSLGLMLKYRRNLAAGASLVLGADVDWSPGDRVEDEIIPQQNGGAFSSYAVGVRQYDYDVTFRGVSPYAQVEVVPASRLRLSAGLRFDAVGYAYTSHLTPDDTSAHRRPASTSVRYAHTSPKLGVTYELSRRVSVFGAYRHGFRVPSEDQLFVQGSAINTIDLEPVQANSFEAGVRGRFARFGVEASLYTLAISHDILTFFDTLNFTSQTSNAGRTRHWGIEIGAGLALTDELRLDAAYSLLRHRYLRWVTATGTDYSGNDMESGPRDVGNARLTWTPGRASLALELAHVGRYFTDPDNVHSYGGYDLLNAYFRVPVAAGLGIAGRVNNIADIRYANTVSFNPFVPPAIQDRFTPGQPRSLYLGVEYMRGGAAGASR
jgi:outer membrane receptor protein involved in Fe transport